MQAVSMAPGAYQGSLMPGQTLAGGAFEPLERFSSLLQGFGGSQQTQSTPFYTNNANAALGGGLLGYQMMNQTQPESQYYSSTPYDGGFGWGNV